MAHTHLVPSKCDNRCVYARGQEQISPDNEDMCEIRDLVFATNVPALNLVHATRNVDRAALFSCCAVSSASKSTPLSVILPDNDELAFWPQC